MLVSLQQAVELLDEGQLVAIPTETVYGLAADAESEQALSRLYATKGRPSGHPVILHVAEAAMAEPYLQALAPAARRLMDAFWPGPLTLLLPKSGLVSEQITGGRPLVGVRAPDSALALEVIRRLGRPVVAPSANRFGHISPTLAEHVEQEFAGQVAVLDGGACGVGLESTIIKVEPSRLVMMRPGQLQRKLLEEVAGLPLEDPEIEVEGVPGALKSHYAPTQPVRLVSTDALRRSELSGTALLVRSEGPWPKSHLVIAMPAEAEGYARQLYSALRQAEASGCRDIAVELPPDTSEWMAIRDRLSRASSPNSPP